MTPLQREFLTPLDEGMVMDMPITVPRMSATQAADDLKARDMVFCRFPEVDMVVGKAGRAETATDPAPLDMIETMIDFRPREFWPRRCLRPADTERQAAAVLDALAAAESWSAIPAMRRPAELANASRWRRSRSSTPRCARRRTSGTRSSSATSAPGRPGSR